MSVPTYLNRRGFLYGLKYLTWVGASHGLSGLEEELWRVTRRQSTAPKPTFPLDYIILAPDFVKSSAGIGCLYKLAYNLKEQGFSVAVAGSRNIDAFRPVPLISMSKAKSAAMRGTWVIYPETVSSNPLCAKNVIRWVLNQPGLLGGQAIYNESEQVFIYSDVYKDYVKNKISGKLFLPTIDSQTFFPPTNESGRNLQCYYVGKSKFKDGYFDQNLVFEIGRHSPTRKDLSNLFRAARVLYCFDNSTALIYEAVLCGCPVIIIPDGTHTWSDYEKLELGTEGFHWDRQTTLPPIPDASILKTKIDEKMKDYFTSVRALIQHTQSIWPTRTPSLMNSNSPENRLSAQEEILQ